MKIEKFTKGKNGMYTLSINGRGFQIHEDLILKYNLLLTKDVSSDLLLTLEGENLKYEAYNIALIELKKRLRSRVELEEILKKKSWDKETISEILELLEKQGYLNDKIYANSYVHDKVLFSSDGPLKVEKDLLKNNIPKEVITIAMRQYTEEVEVEKISKIIAKHIKSNTKSKILFLQKMKYLLINNLGYHTVCVERELSNIDINDNVSYKKEYDKLYKKLSKKYEGNLLEYKIKEKLYTLGFKVDY